MVRVVGLEPTLPKKPDFESGASTNSATPAQVRSGRNIGDRGPPVHTPDESFRGYQHGIARDTPGCYQRASLCRCRSRHIHVTRPL